MRNLNSKPKILYRTANQTTRRAILRLRKKKRRELMAAKREIASKETLTDTDLRELRRLNWQLGSGSIYRLTPEQAENAANLVREIMARKRCCSCGKGPCVCPF